MNVNHYAKFQKTFFIPHSWMINRHVQMYNLQNNEFKKFFIMYTSYIADKGRTSTPENYMNFGNQMGNVSNLW